MLLSPGSACHGRLPFPVMAPKGVSNRTLLAKKKGIKMGQTIIVSYREEGRGTAKTYEGVLSDRRIGGTDRESYLELKKCLQLGPSQEVVAQEGNKRFVDAFIDDIDITEPRPDIDPQAAAAEAAAAAAAAATSVEPDASPMGMMPMGMGMPGMMPGMGMAGMGMPGMGMAGMGMPCMGGGMGMPGMGMNMGMGMPGMGMGMPMMNPMMNPMAAMGMMQQGMAAMMPMRAMAMSMQAMAGRNMAANSAEGAEAMSAAAVAMLTARSADGGELGRPEDVNTKLDAIDTGRSVHVDYTHPQLGKTKYGGVLADKYTGASHLQSYIELTGSQRIGKRGQMREREATKRLMVAFIDDVKVLPAAEESRSRSRSRRRGGAEPQPQ